MTKQYDYKHWLQVFSISEEAGESLIESSELLGVIAMHREHIPEDEHLNQEELETITVAGEKRDVYAYDYIYQVEDGGDIFRKRDNNRVDSKYLPRYELVTGGKVNTGMLARVYENEWERHEYDENNYYWFEWSVEKNNNLPERIVELLPHRCEATAEPED